MSNEPRIVRVIGTPGKPSRTFSDGRVEFEAAFEVSRDWWGRLTLEALASEVEHVARVTCEVDARCVVLVGDGFGATTTRGKALAWVEGALVASTMRECDSGQEFEIVMSMLSGSEKGKASNDQ